MGKYIEREYINKKEILKFPDHYVAMAVLVDDTGIIANSDGKKIVPAGTIVGGVGGSTIKDDTKKVAKKNTQGGATGSAGAGVDAEGVLMWDVDVTYGSASGSMILHGYINVSKIPEAPCADAEKSLSQIKFIK